MLQLQPIIGAIPWCMSRYIQPSGPIHKRYINLPKGHKLEGLILVGERNRSLRRRGVEIPMYSSFHVDFPDVEFFASQSYIYVV